MKTPVRVGIALVVVTLAALVAAQKAPAAVQDPAGPVQDPAAAAQDPGVDPMLQEVLDTLPTPGSGEVFVRTIPADVLRDHPGVCFSYTNNAFFKVNDTWRIQGICAEAECMALPVDKQGRLGLFEQVFDCGPPVPENVTECRITQEESLQLPYPRCCPKFSCDPNFDARDLLMPSGLDLLSGGADPPPPL